MRGHGDAKDPAMRQTLRLHLVNDAFQAVEDEVESECELPLIVGVSWLEVLLRVPCEVWELVSRHLFEELSYEIAELLLASEIHAHLPQSEAEDVTVEQVKCVVCQVVGEASPA